MSHWHWWCVSVCSSIKGHHTELLTHHLCSYFYLYNLYQQQLSFSLSSFFLNKKLYTIIPDKMKARGKPSLQEHKGNRKLTSGVFFGHSTWKQISQWINSEECFSIPLHRWLVGWRAIRPPNPFRTFFSYSEICGTRTDMGSVHERNSQYTRRRQTGTHREKIKRK